MMNRFDSLTQRVFLLNHQIEAVKDSPTSEARRAAHEQLWEIVADLNYRVGLNLDNNCLDLTIVKGRLCIHFWTGPGSSSDTETNIYIDKHFSVTRHTKDMSTGRLRIWALKGSPPSVIWVEK